MFTRFVLIITQAKISQKLVMIVCALFTPAMVLTPKLSAVVRFNSFRSSASFRLDSRKLEKTRAFFKKTQFSIWRLAHSPYSGFFQCKELADGKYQSKVLEEGTSKDFGSQDKSFPEDTFWINLVRSSQQTFLWRYSPKENLQKALLIFCKCGCSKSEKMKVFPCFVWRV